MSDNIALPTGEVVSTDEIAGVHHQRTKVQFGEDGALALDVSVTDPLPTQIISPVEITDRGKSGVAVFLQDQTSGLLDISFLQSLTNLSLISNTVINTRNIALNAGHGLTTNNNAGDTVEIADTTNGSYFFTGKIVSVSGDILLMDNPINRIFTVGSSIVIHSSNAMAVDGSVTPVVFAVAPTSLQIGDMVRCVLTITDNTDMDFETFGGMPKLTNGCVLRVNNGDGTYRNIFNFKSNNDIAEYAYDTGYFTNNGGGIRGFQARLTWGGPSKHGVVVRLDGSLGEALELVVQDDLTDLSGMTWLAQGSEVQ
jgi:hypothetical protein